MSAIAEAVPPLEEFARAAFESVSAGAVPTGIIAAPGPALGLQPVLRGARLRLHADLPRRTQAERDRADAPGRRRHVPPRGRAAGGARPGPDHRVGGRGPARADRGGDPAAGVARGIVPAVRDRDDARLPVRARASTCRGAPWRCRRCSSGSCSPGSRSCTRCWRRCSRGWPPSTARSWPFFAILAWLSISFNLLLFGACWTRVRERGLPEPADRRGQTIRGAAGGCHGPAE